MDIKKHLENKDTIIAVYFKNGKVAIISQNSEVVCMATLTGQILKTTITLPSMINHIQDIGGSIKIIHSLGEPAPQPPDIGDDLLGGS